MKRSPGGGPPQKERKGRDARRLIEWPNSDTHDRSQVLNLEVKNLKEKIITYVNNHLAAAFVVATPSTSPQQGDGGGGGGGGRVATTNKLRDAR